MTPEVERQVVDLIGKRFISHGRNYAEQWKSNDREGYKPVEGGLTRAALTAHLRGERSLGHYLVSPDDDHVKLLAFDLDARKALTPIEREQGATDPVVDGQAIVDSRHELANPDSPFHHEVKMQLSIMGFMLALQTRDICRGIDVNITCAVAFSGNKGIHVYGWFDQRIPAANARKLAIATLKSFDADNMPFVAVRGDNFYRNDTDFPCVEVETFPKQDSLVESGKTHGNLMRLPLGVHLKSGRPSFFMRSIDFTPMDPVEALERGCIG